MKKTTTAFFLAFAPVGASAESLLHQTEVWVAQASLLTDTLPVSGPALADKSATISVRVSGIIKSVSVQPGDKVAGGQVLAEIEPADLINELESATSAHAAAISAHEAQVASHARNEELRRSGMLSQQQFDASLAEVKRAKGNLDAAAVQMENATQNLDRASVKAPFSGIISERFIEPGQLVNSGREVLRLVDPAKLTVEVRLSELDSYLLEPGQRAELRIPKDAASIDATVTRINPELSGPSRTARAYIAIDNTNGALRSGSYLVGEVVTREAPGVAIPAAAIIDIDGTKGFYAITEGRIEAVKLEGMNAWGNGKWVDVSGLIAPGTQIIARPLSGLKPGTAVRVAE